MAPSEERPAPILRQNPRRLERLRRIGRDRIAGSRHCWVLAAALGSATLPCKASGDRPQLETYAQCRPHTRTPVRARTHRVRKGVRAKRTDTLVGSVVGPNKKTCRSMQPIRPRTGEPRSARPAAGELRGNLRDSGEVRHSAAPWAVRSMT
jgi:hypothetical protein